MPGDATRVVELVVKDGSPNLAVCVVDMATGRRFGAVLRMALEITAESDVATATLSYMRLEGSPDGTLPPDRPEALVPFLGDDGEPEIVTEKVRVGRFAARQSHADPVGE